MKPLKQRIVDMLFRLEWSSNKLDGHGGRCPFCEKVRGVPHDCELSRLMAGIRSARAPRDNTIDDVVLPKE